MEQPTVPLTDAQQLIADECDQLKALLLSKNQAYGNSALDPVRIFSKADPVEQIKVRLDDKLSRLSRGSASGEDVEQDFMGYLVLLRVARKMDGARTEKRRCQFKIDTTIGYTQCEKHEGHEGPHQSAEKVWGDSAEGSVPPIGMKCRNPLCVLPFGHEGNHLSVRP